MTRRTGRITTATVLVLLLLAGALLLVRTDDTRCRTTVVADFTNSNGIFVGDDVRILGVPVGKITDIENRGGHARITFWFDNQYQVPANVNAVVLSPTLISARAIQLTPAYTGGPALQTGARIGADRTAVPVEWDDLRAQLNKLADTLQPTAPGGVSPLGDALNVAADNMRGNGQAVRATLTELSQAMSALGDHSSDVFSTVRNLALLVSALKGSSQLMSDLNANLADVTQVLTNTPDEVGTAVSTLAQASADVTALLNDNREPLGTSVDLLSSITGAINESNYDLKQILHIAPTLLANFANIYQPAQATITGALAANQFANPVQFLCSAIQAASRLGAEQSAKLCVQYLAPIVKNRQYNFLPLGLNPIVGATARPNEITYSEDRLRPDYQPLATDAPPAPAQVDPAPPPLAPLPAEAPLAQQTDPADGLPGLMVPGGAPR